MRIITCGGIRRRSMGGSMTTMRLLRRDFLPKDLMAEMAAAGIDGAVAVQARQTLEETRWLLELAEEC